MIEIQVLDTLKIGGYDYRIVQSKELDIRLRDDAVRGTHSDTSRTIEISTDLSPQQKSATFLHEFLHAIDSVYLSKGISNENIIHGIANGLLQIFEQLGIRLIKTDV